MLFEFVHEKAYIRHLISLFCRNGVFRRLTTRSEEERSGMSQGGNMRIIHVLLCVTCFILVTSTCSCDSPASPDIPPEASVLQLDSLTGQQAFLTWTECQASDFYSYRLYRSTAPSVADQDTLSMYLVCSSLSKTLTSATDSTLISGTYYYYALLTSDTEGLSNWSNETAAFDIPPTPSVLSGDSTAQEQVLLTWTQCPDADFQSYRLYRSLTEDIAAQDTTALDLVFSTADPSAISFADSSLEAMNTYYYALLTTDSGELLAWSNEISVYAEYVLDFPHTVTGTVPVEGSRGVCFSTLEGSAFATSFFSSKIYKINTETDTVEDILQYNGGYLDACCTDENGQYLFSVWYENTDNAYASAVVVTNASTNNHVKTITLPGDNARGICYIPGRDEIYVCMAGSNCVRIIDVNTLQISGIIPTDAYNTRRVCSDTTGETAYVSRTNSDDIAVINTQTLQTIDYIPTAIESPDHLCVTPDGEYLYYSSFGRGVGIIHLPTGTGAGLMTMPTNTGEVCMHPSGDYVYIALHDSIGIIDTELKALVHVIDIPGAGIFRYIDCSPDGTKIYASSYLGVYVIE